jgi:alpha-L-fucosidase
LYHTTADWYKEEFQQDFKAYLKYLRDSVEILCTNYGEIGGFWFDGNWWKKNNDWEEDALYGMIRKHQPNAIIVNNTGTSARGAVGNPEIDSVTFEQGRPTPMDREGMPKYLAAEMCHTMNEHWGFGENDYNYKSAAHLIETLCSCRKVGANYLLNIGPKGDGSVPLLQEAMALAMGDWINKTGACIYKGRPCGVLGDGKNFALEADGKLYFFVHDLTISGNENVTVAGGGAGEKRFAGVKGKVKSVRWVDNGEELDFTQEGDEFKVNCTAYPYGTSLVVRIAEAEME